MKRAAIALTLVFFALGGTGSVMGADPPKDRDKFHDRIETLTMWRMMDALDLDRGTADKIFEIRHKFLAQRKELRASLNDDIDNLKKILANPPKATDDKELSQLIAGIREKRKKLQALQDEQYTEVSKVLTVRQQAQLILFFKEFLHELRGMMRERPRLGAPGGPGMGRRGIGPLPGDSPMGRMPGPPPDRTGPGPGHEEWEDPLGGR